MVHPIVALFCGQDLLLDDATLAEMLQGGVQDGPSWKLFDGKIWSCSCKGWETMPFKMESLVRTESTRMESFADIVQLFRHASFCQMWTLPNHTYLTICKLISISSVGYHCPTFSFRRIPHHKIDFKFSKTTGAKSNPQDWMSDLNPSGQVKKTVPLTSSNFRGIFLPEKPPWKNSYHPASFMGGLDRHWFFRLQSSISLGSSPTRTCRG